MTENYIHRLQREKGDLIAQLEQAHRLVDEFRAHLLTPKFHEDTTIQVRDVDARLVALRSVLLP